jgi:hypothetical protein
MCVLMLLAFTLTILTATGTSNVINTLFLQLVSWAEQTPGFHCGSHLIAFTTYMILGRLVLVEALAHVVSALFRLSFHGMICVLYIHCQLVMNGRSCNKTDTKGYIRRYEFRPKHLSNGNNSGLAPTSPLCNLDCHRLSPRCNST